MDKVSLKSKLYRYYLPALTSHGFKGRLTDRIRTEETLDDLRSPLILSFNSLDKDELELLVRITQLIPLYIYYLRHLQGRFARRLPAAHPPWVIGW